MGGEVLEVRINYHYHLPDAVDRETVVMNSSLFGLQLTAKAKNDLD